MKHGTPAIRHPILKVYWCPKRYLVTSLYQYNHDRITFFFFFWFFSEDPVHKFRTVDFGTLNTKMQHQYQYHHAIYFPDLKSHKSIAMKLVSAMYRLVKALSLWSLHLAVELGHVEPATPATGAIKRQWNPST